MVKDNPSPNCVAPPNQSQTFSTPLIIPLPVDHIFLYLSHCMRFHIFSISLPQRLCFTCFPPFHSPYFTHYPLGVQRLLFNFLLHLFFLFGIYFSTAYGEHSLKRVQLGVHIACSRYFLMNLAGGRRHTHYIYPGICFSKGFFAILGKRFHIACHIYGWGFRFSFAPTYVSSDYTQKTHFPSRGNLFVC